MSESGLCALRGGIEQESSPQRKSRDLCALALARCNLPVKEKLERGDFEKISAMINAAATYGNNGPELAVVGLSGVGQIPMLEMMGSRLCGLLWPLRRRSSGWRFGWGQTQVAV